MINDRDAELTRMKLDAVPLFPLPELVHFPHAVLPLHVFEARYRAMVADALASDRLMATALMKNEHEAADSASPGKWPSIHPVVCVGRIIEHERLADGRYNLLLEGVARARVHSATVPGGSHRRKMYRIARLAPLQEIGGMEIDLERHRARLSALLWSGAASPNSDSFRSLLQGPTPTAKIADLLAFHRVEEPRLKQAILTDRNVPRRVDRLIGTLQAQWQPRETVPEAAFN